MLFKINFFPFQYVLALIILIVVAIVFHNTIYTFISANFVINGIIIGLFIFCTIWILGSLSYYSRSAKVFSRLLRGVAPVVKKSSKGSKNKEAVIESSTIVGSSSPITGTLFDSPLISTMLAKVERKKKLEVTRTDVNEIIAAVYENAARVMAPSRFVATIFTMMGLFGTFLGLLNTIAGVAKALSLLSQNTGAGASPDISSFIGVLSEPLGGMATAFSASLFGLLGSLISNFGNYVAWQKLSGFVIRVKNYLLAHTGVFDEDPTRINARDLLISLEEAFDTLYRGLTSKFDTLNKNISGMHNVIARTQERQEKMIKVLLRSNEFMEHFWRKFLNADGLSKVISEIVGRISREIPEIIRKVMEPSIKMIVGSIQENNRMMDRALVIANEHVEVSKDIAEMIDENNEISSKVEAELTTMSKRDDLLEVMKLIEENNGINADMVALFEESNNIGNKLIEDNIAKIEIAENTLNATVDSIKISEDMVNAIDETTRTTEGVIAAVADNNKLVGTLTNLMSDSNSINIDNGEVIRDIASMSGSSVGLLQNLNAINEEGNRIELEIQNLNVVGNSIGEGVIQAINENNNLVSNNNSLVEQGNYLQNQNNSLTGLSNDLLGNSLPYYQQLVGLSNEINSNAFGIIKILDERLGMIISFSRDNLSLSSGIASLVNEFKDNLLGYYVSLDLNNKLNGILELNSAQVSILSNVSENSSRQNTLLDIGSQQIEILSNLYGNSSVGLSSLNEIQGKIDYLTSVQVETMSGANNTLYQVASRMENLLMLLTNLGEAVNAIGSLTIENKNEFSSSMDNLLKQTQFVNDNLVNMGEMSREGFSNIIDGVNTIGNVYSEFTNVIKSMLSNIIDTISSEESINYLSQNIHKIENAVTNAADLQSQLLDSQRGDLQDIKKLIDNLNETMNQIANITGLTDYTENNINDIARSNADVLEAIINVNNNMSVINDNLSTMQDARDKYLTNITSNIDTISNNVNYLTDILNNLTRANEVISAAVNNIGSSNFSGNQEISMLLNNINKEIAELNNYKDQISRDLENIANTSFRNLSDNFMTISNKLDQFAPMRDGSNNNNPIFENISRMIDILSRDFKSFNSNIDSVSSRILQQEKVLGNLSEAIDNLNYTTKDLRNLSAIIDKLGNNVKTSSDSSLNKEMVDSIKSLSEKITSLFYNVGSSNGISKEDKNLELSRTLINLNENTDDIKRTLNNIVNSKLVNEFSRILDGQKDFTSRFVEFSSVISNLTSKLENSVLGGGFDKVKEALDEISNNGENGNEKLNVLVRALDTLVTEMLNSRQISKSILDILADLGGYRRV